MNAFIISYDLKSSGRDYTSLYDQIKSLGEWQHPLESVWVVFAEYPAGVSKEEYLDNMSNSIRNEMTAEDLLLIFEIKPEVRQGWLATSFWQWMRDKVNGK